MGRKEFPLLVQMGAGSGYNFTYVSPDTGLHGRSRWLDNISIRPIGLNADQKKECVRLCCLANCPASLTCVWFYAHGIRVDATYFISFSINSFHVLQRCNLDESTRILVLLSTKNMHIWSVYSNITVICNTALCVCVRKRKTAGFMRNFTIIWDGCLSRPSLPQPPMPPCPTVPPCCPSIINGVTCHHTLEWRRYFAQWRHGASEAAIVATVRYIEWIRT